MKAVGILLLRTLGAVLVGGAATLIYITTLMAGLSSAYDAFSFLGTFLLGLALFGPFLVVGVHYLFHPWTWTRPRVRLMRWIVWGLPAVPTILLFGLAAFSDQGFAGQSNDVSNYLVLFALSAGLATVLIRPQRG